MTDEFDKTIPPQRAAGNMFDMDKTMPGYRDRQTDGRFAVGDLIMGRYKVLAELGQGGMGVVYKCFDETAGIEVALKALPPELSHNSLEMDDIKENFQLVHNLHHPNIASSNNLERNPVNGNYYLIMECCEGEDLRRWIKRKRRDNPLALNDVLPVIRQVADALDYAHGEKVMHRDIKPGNIMIDSRGKVKVLDFGLAAQIHTSMTRVSMAYHGTSGTGPYMAPEQWRGRAQGAAADQYALAVMAYEMLAGRLPFESTDPSVLREAVLNDTAEEIAELPAAAQNALKRAMSKEAADRFNSCADFAAALGGAKVAKSKKVSSGKSGGGAWKWIAAVIVLALIAAGAFFALNRNTATPTAPVPADTAALKIDSANHEALALKNEAEAHLVPTLQITPTVDGASVPATVKIDNNAWRAGDTIRDLTGAYKARSVEGRAIDLKAGGGGDNTERAVIRALNWLVKVQNDDGSWGDWQDNYNQKVQLTCLALLAMLAHGETPESERYGGALNQGLKLVLSWANAVSPNRGGSWGRHEAGEDENGNIQYKSNDWYAMSRIAIVLAEGYAITKDPALKEGMDRVVTRLINEMNPSGGFGWHWDERLEKNIDHFSLDGGSRLYNALYSAYNAGCEVSGKDYNGKTVTIEDAIDRAISAISKRHACAEGGFSYGVQNDRKTYPAAGFDSTGVGTFYLFLMGYNGQEAQKGYEWLLNHRPNGKENSEMKMDWTNLPSRTSALGWYYMTQALFQATGGRGAEWRRWNRQMTTALIKEQSREGYWECPADKYEQWEFVRERQRDGSVKEIKRKKQYNESKLGGFTEHNARIWATVYFTLTLEVYYRYLPTFKEDGTRNKEADIANDKKEASSAENADGGGEVLTDDQEADIML